MLERRVVWKHQVAGADYILNEHVDASGNVDQTKTQDTVIIDERLYDPAFRDGREAYHLALGGGLNRVHKGLAYWRLRGRILVPDSQTMVAALEDKERTLRAAFDPALCLNDSPSTDGAYALEWVEPTLDTTNFPSGISARIYVRPAVQPSVVEDKNSIASRLFAIGLVAADPRLYHQTEQTLALTPGSPTGNVINRGTVPAALKATIVMSAAGATNFTIARGGVSFILDLSTMVNTDQVVVIFETSGPYGRGKFITKNAVENAALMTSLPNTWLDAPAGTTSFTISNTTGVTSCTLAWRHSWA